MVEKNGEVIHVPSAEIETIEDFEVLTKKLKEREKFYAVMRVNGLKATSPSDWVEQNGNPYLMGSGVNKVARKCMLKIWDVRPERENVSDDNGEYRVFRYMGKVGWSENECSVAIGLCSTRDQFFATRGGRPIPQADVDVTNIEKAAYTNFVVRGVTEFLGLKNLTWEELKHHGIDRKNVQKVDYGKTTKSGKWTKEQTEKAKRLREWMLAEADGDQKAAGEALEKATEFEDKETGKMVKGKTSTKNLSGKQVDFLFKQNKKAIEEFEGATNESAGESK